LRLTASELAERVLKGDRASLARAITLAESALPGHQELAEEILERCLPHTGKALRVGISGAPGAGKSTFIEALGCHLTQERGETVAVLAIDPSSPITGGSILGDKTRMPALAGEDRAFIRPSPSRGTLGGVTRSTRQAILLCEAAGFRNVLVETVGAGQSDVAVASMTDCFLLLLLPGAGDELQGIKRGVIEMADILIINKADGDYLVEAKRARQAYETALDLFPPPPHGWRPVVATCSALLREGIREIWDHVLRHRAHMEQSGWFKPRRAEQARLWMRELIEESLRAEFFGNGAIQRRLETIESMVESGGMSALRAARRLLETFRDARKE
jgi:LAO/AO transport system kinase